jgi:hypothetical protein
MFWCYTVSSVNARLTPKLETHPSNEVPPLLNECIPTHPQNTAVALLIRNLMLRRVVVTRETLIHSVTHASLTSSAIFFLRKPCNPASGNKDDQNVPLWIFKSVNGQEDNTRERCFSKFLSEAGTVQCDIIYVARYLTTFSVWRLQSVRW